MYRLSENILDANPIAKKILAALAIVCLFLPNTLLIIYAMVSLVIILKYTWPKGHLPIVTVCLLFQWVQATTKILQATLENKDVNAFTNSPFAAMAIALSITGILIVSLGFKLALTKTSLDKSVFSQSQFDEHRAFKLFLFLFALSSMSELMTYLIPSISQITLSVSHIQWVGYAILFITCLNKRANYKYLVIAFCIEMATNLFGFFSNFREVLLFTLILYLPYVRKISIRAFAIYAITCYLVYLFFVGWTGIKNDFRKNLMDNSNLSYYERVNIFYDLYNGFETYDEAEENGLDRLAYTDMLMYCIETVPFVTPYENGKLWIGALEHILKPRFLFPNKKILNDSEKANAYTGREWAGTESGTSISIGYVAESYVDFGYVLMFVPLFILGLIIGLIHNIVVKLKVSSIISFSIIACILFFTKFSLLETSGDKLLGALVMNFVIIYTLSRLYAKKLQSYLLKS